MNVYEVELHYADGRNEYIVCRATTPEAACEIVRVLLVANDNAINRISVIVRRQL